MRQLLPHKDAPTVLYSALNQWQQLPIANKQQLVSPKVEQALKSLAEQLRSPLQLSQPKILAQIVKNSGLLFESKLNQLPQGNTTTNAINAAVTALSRQDLKGSLLNLLSKVTEGLSGENKTLNSEQTQKLVQQLRAFVPFASPNPTTGNKNEVPSNIGLLMQQLMTKPVNELSDKDLRTQLLVLLQQHSVHSLAKIQLQQLHSLNHELESKDSSQPTSSWQLEIPVKHQNEVQQLHLRIDREWIDEKNESEKNTTVTKIKQWSVTLRFDLPKLGEFCAQLAIVEKNVSATLWATRENTFAEVKKQMEVLRGQLENEGIQVKQLQCLKGMPPLKPMALSYSLIDVST